MPDIFEFLAANGISYGRFDHPAVFTTAESEMNVPELPAASAKNLFLRDNKGLRHFLLVVGFNAAVDLKALSVQLEVKRIGFASEERLMTHLGISTGSFSLLALINDPENKVEVIIDQAIWDADALAMHPLINTATLCVSHDDLERFLELTGHHPNVLSVPVR